MSPASTAPQRGVLASFAFLLISMLSAQAVAFDDGDFSYSITSATTVEVRCRDRKTFVQPCRGNLNIVIPGTVSINGTTYSVTFLGAMGAVGVTYGFGGNALTSVIIPDSVEIIGDYAFAGNLLTSVIIPDSVTTIGEFAFWGNLLTSVIIPDGVSSIDRSAFASNDLTSVIIPDSVTTIGEDAFSDNNLTSVIIPDRVTTIGNNAFYNNVLTSVTIPDSVTTIGDYAFSGPTASLTSVTIGNSVTSIGGSAFSGNNLTSVIIPDSVTTIGDFAFYDNALTSVTIGARVTTIGKDAFYNNYTLTSVTIGNSVTTIGSGAFGYNALTSVTIPASVTTIGQYAFAPNALTSAHFGGNFGDFQLNTTGSGSTEREAMFDANPNLTTITYCEGTTGWPQDFSNGSTTITATSIVCSPPDAPTIDSITPGAGQLTVAFTPGIDNGSPASSYTASCLRVVGSGRVRVNVVGPTSPITVPSMYNGDTYECFVTATNIIGTSPASATSEPFVVGPPDTFVPPPPPSGTPPPTYGTPPPSTDTPPSSATPVPTSPLWLLGIMAGLLSLVGFRKLRKA
jgi:hypothetical protein